MAEMVVSLTVDKLLPLLREETLMLRGIHKDFADINKELKFIQTFLMDVDRRRAVCNAENNNEGIKTWVNQVVEVAYRIEDIIDDYTIFMNRQPHHHLGCAASLYRFVGVIKTSKQRHQIASEIKDVKLAVRGIKERRDRYGIQIEPYIGQGSNNSIRQQNRNWHDPRMASLYMDEVIGFEAPKKRLIGWLVDGRVERTVVSVVGMGGQGKTTLAKKVFDSKEVIGHFDCRTWITVSETYSPEGLLRDMLSKLYKQTGESLPQQDIVQMDRGSLIENLRICLQKKRYVIVFDDVWNVHFWDEIEFAVIDKNNGSRIFITTRNSDVAFSCKQSSFVEVHELQPLNLEQSRELFNMKVFRFDYEGRCPNELRDISSQIIKKCKGLPLAIVVIGGLLSTKKKNTLEWERFYKNLSSELEKDSHLIGITRILGLSYDDLPYYLKSLLLYFGIYPEDYEVDSERLIRQWIAEGFVKEEGDKTLEEVAEGCLAELIRRSLVQVSKVGIDGKAKACRVHDLIRVMVREKFEELYFCKDISEDSQSALSVRIRRLSIGTTSTSNDLTCDEIPHVRSLFVFTNGYKIPNHFVSLILTKYRRLKVLDFEDAVLLTFPKNLKSLIHLKYLRLTCPLEDELPKSIGLLQNLETLDVRGKAIHTMPEEISRLRKLRHLLGSGLSLIRLKNSIGGLKSLQTLSFVKLGEDGDEGLELIRNMGKLKLLREISLSWVRIQCEGVLSSSISQMQHLEKLQIGLESNDGSVFDLNLITFSPILQNITLSGKLTRLPEGIPNLQNLIELVLKYTYLIDDPVKSLKDMPNLLRIHLLAAYKGESLHFEDGGFQKLKELCIERLHHLNSIVIEKGALHSLKKLELEALSNLQMVPPGIQYMEKLQVLSIREMPIEFVKSIAPDGGKDHWVVEHVPHVDVSPKGTFI